MSDRPNSTEPPGPEQEGSDPDLTVINGIGPALAKRLHAVGIGTVSDLARLTSRRVAALLGPESRVSAQRIEDEDWIGQAQRHLAPAELTIADLGQPGAEQRYLTFHVEFLIDPDDQVRRTKVHHYQTDTEERWAGWDPDQLAAYFSQRLADMPPPAPSGAPAVEPVQFEILGFADGGSRLPFLREGDQVTVILQFKVNEIEESDVRDLDYRDLDYREFDYAVSVDARTVGQRVRNHVGSHRGSGTIGEEVSVEWTGAVVPCGLHFLEADLRLFERNGAHEAPIARHLHRGALINVAPAPARQQPHPGGHPTGLQAVRR